ncbi:VanW family protein [Paractinoplanes durhamensis]|uniref:VanW family protein n=1 Tax=Paractinoplanes durhamensis TaxID=113563 RepID=UPI003624D8A9
MAGVAVGGLDERRLRATVESEVRTRVGQPVTVQVTDTDRTFTLDPVTAGITLDVDATVKAALDGADTAAVTVDAAKLRTALDAQKQAATDTVVKLATPTPRLEAKGDTSFTASTAGVDRTAGKAGWTVDEKAAASAIESAVRSGRSKTSVTSTAVPSTTTPAELAGVDQLIGTFTTYHPCCAPRVTNIHLIAKIVDGTVIKPGTKFSLNEKVGERTEAKGFVAAPAIVDGELEDQLGGGISQFSTTLFNAAWFAGLPILKHQPHSKYISRYPPAREATLDWGNIDQVIRNDTDAPVVIRVKTTGTSVTVALYGHTGERKVASVTGARNPTGAEGGFSIRVTRTVYDDGTKAGTDTLRWTYDGLD